MEAAPVTAESAPKRRHRWPVALLLVLPYLGLGFPSLYARANPSLFGFPFFYWYQIAWVALTSVLLTIVYRLSSSRQRAR